VISQAQMWAFIRRFYPCLIGTYLLALFATAMATLSVINTYFLKHAYESELAMSMLAVGTLAITLGTFILIRGRTWAVWIIVVLLFVCFLATLSTYGRSSHMLLFVASLAASLLGLLIINSRPYRQMCKRVVVIRRMRNRCAAGGGNK